MSKKPGFQVVLYYVTAPSEEQLQGIWNFVLGKYVNDDRSAEDIDFSVEYDESLGGGFILKCGNEVYNWSTRGRLGQFNEKLQAREKAGCLRRTDLWSKTSFVTVDKRGFCLLT